MSRVGNNGIHQLPVVGDATVAVERPPFRFTTRSFQRYPVYLQTPLDHQVADPVVKQDMQGPVANYHVDPLSIFPYMALPPCYLLADETPLEALDRILRVLTCGRQKIRESNRWIYPHASGRTNIDEQTAKFLNLVIAGSNTTVQLVPPAPVCWRSHSNAETEDKRKPDVILVPIMHEAQSNVPTSAILSYCEVKYKFNKCLQDAALLQLMEMAGLATTSQFGRRFFVGMSLCGRHLSLACFVRGCTLFTDPFDIDQDPIKFLHILLTLSAAETASAWTGFDKSYPISHMASYSHQFALPPPSPDSITCPATSEPLPIKTIYPLFRAHGMAGKGTVVSACKAYVDGVVNDPQDAVLKECWVSEDWPNDIDINRLLNTRMLNPIPEEDIPIFGQADEYKIFSNCTKVPDEWDDTKHLAGIPIVCEWQDVCSDTPVPFKPDDDVRRTEVPNLRPDTTQNIVERFQLTKGKTLYFEPRKHILTLSRTCGIPIQLFSCRRELLNGFMGALVGHYNGLRKGVLHCDVSEGNIWLRIARFNLDDAIPSWGCEGGEGFILRAGMLGDWGSGLNVWGKEQPGYPKKERMGFVTGTFPYIATELLSGAGQAGKVPHTVRHDLESFFWVLWSLSINQAGPYEKQRKWLDRTQASAAANATTGTPPATAATPASIVALSHPSSSTKPTLVATTNKPTTEPYAGSTRRAADQKDSSVPAWATDGNYPCTFDEVFQWRTRATDEDICNPISPYFSEGQGGQAFNKGMQQLFQYFKYQKCPAASHHQITHKTFIDILKVMRDAIEAAEDIPSADDVKQARAAYQKWIDSKKGLLVPASTSFLQVTSSRRTGNRASSASATKRTQEEMVGRDSKRQRSSQSPLIISR